jgi:hypothetical protein
MRLASKFPPTLLSATIALRSGKFTAMSRNLCAITPSIAMMCMSTFPVTGVVVISAAHACAQSVRSRLIGATRRTPRNLTFPSRSSVATRLLLPGRMEYGRLLASSAGHLRRGCVRCQEAECWDENGVHRNEDGGAGGVRVRCRRGRLRLWLRAGG